jgi:hypothetical protein
MGFLLLRELLFGFANWFFLFFVIVVIVGCFILLCVKFGFFVFVVVVCFVLLFVRIVVFVFRWGGLTTKAFRSRLAR